LVEGIHAGKIFRLHSDVTLIGRDPSCDIVLDDQAISRQHVKIRSDEGDEDEQVFVLHDLATENGTFVNDEEVLKHELSDGDHVRMGRTQMVFKQVQP
jgi:pSer/pThr/pTyr-binding forkhead associated (FHA) protein